MAARRAAGRPGTAGRLRARHASSTSRSSSPTAPTECCAASTTCAATAPARSRSRRATARACSAATTAGRTAWTARCAQRRRWRRPRTSARRTSGCVPVRVDRWGPFVFANLDPDAPPLRDVMGAIPAEVARAGYDVEHMRLVERREYLIECNWKVYVDNYLEGYHLPDRPPGALQGARLRRLPGRDLPLLLQAARAHPRAEGGRGAGPRPALRAHR